uniref:sigma-70 family RNA polymerase sigma factor n=1 Tax=Candidatus Fimivicinus sp. TaxID=3056640 RepID=UPI003FEE95AC
MPNPAFDAKLEQMTDESLAVRARGGDDGAMALLTARMVPLVKMLAVKYGGGAMEPEDLAQEGMFGFLAAVHGFDEKNGVPFRSYAGVCIANRIRSAVRAGARLKNIPLNSYISLSDDSVMLSETQPNPEDLVIARDEVVRLDDLMARRLSKFERRVIQLYLGGRSYEDIAARLGSTAKSVDNALQRVRRKLRFMAEG